MHKTKLFLFLEDITFFCTVSLINFTNTSGLEERMPPTGYSLMCSKPRKAPTGISRASSIPFSELDCHQVCHIWWICMLALPQLLAPECRGKLNISIKSHDLFLYLQRPGIFLCGLKNQTMRQIGMCSLHNLQNVCLQEHEGKYIC